ncbi:hypothetical protein M422DRAFT_268615 [Sphaerobolus stellatus SS14]|uniref:PH domain-containing protein n=1 Tax=Sphaerobolus stellatus (strain SS14) TaxID=990650 RepID=A0A0C9U6R1_SPHS4|nr:hypothetical protein M422DRAFT_268615 [Sphaerobolus stellatus SS14]
MQRKKSDPSPWSTVLEPSEFVQLASMVEVKTGKLIFQRTDQRTLILTSKPRLLSVKLKGNSEGPIVKEDFSLSKDHDIAKPSSVIATSNVSLKGDKALVVNNGDKSFTYTFSEPSEANLWVRTLQNQLGISNQ